MVKPEGKVQRASETELLIHSMMDAQMFSPLREDGGRREEQKR